MISSGEIESVTAKAVAEAGIAGGAFLEGLNETDVANLTPDKWRKFIATVCEAYHSALQALVAGDSAADEGGGR